MDNLAIIGEKTWWLACPGAKGKAAFDRNQRVFYQRAGDLLVIPSGWYHEVCIPFYSLSHSLSHYSLSHSLPSQVVTEKVDNETGRAASYSIMHTNKGEISLVQTAFELEPESLTTPPGLKRNSKWQVCSRLAELELAKDASVAKEMVANVRCECEQAEREKAAKAARKEADKEARAREREQHAVLRQERAEQERAERERAERERAERERAERERAEEQERAEQERAAKYAALLQEAQAVLSYGEKLHRGDLGAAAFVLRVRLFPRYTRGEVERAHRTLAAKFHPDRIRQDAPEKERQVFIDAFIALTKARELLAP